MKIIAVENKSTGAELGLKIGDKIVAINGKPVADVIDYQFMITEEEVELEIERNGASIVFEIEKEYDDQLGLGLEDIKIRRCGNDCPFCFVDQNPAGMRQALYFRDEDFRLSFLSGHYVTLTNLSQKDMTRIVEQRLSPMFVSVHATEPEVRKFLLGIDHDDRLFEKLKFLTEHEIELHTQIVLCPEVNDGSVLEKTIHDLAGYLPRLKSVSIVPVGLTRHRAGLIQLKPVTVEYAVELIRKAENYAADYHRETGEYFVYLSDEFYILAAQPLPPASRYDGFYQKENGVGMVRFMLDEFERQKPRFPAALAQPFRVTLVTASLASGFMKNQIVPALNEVENFYAQLETVRNRFYGDSIQVTGLLTGQDLYDHLSRAALGDKIFLPANCLKDGAVFLDDWTLEQLRAKLNCPVQAVNNDFSVLFENLT
ncbi:MAG: DUF512 domain-containing protein [bacterium]